jgi:hypothetical protein
VVEVPGPVWARLPAADGRDSKFAFELHQAGPIEKLFPKQMFLWKEIYRSGIDSGGNL